ncbi:hypothetical protein F3Y22_tig00110782pilonHSYRG00075 [Hibiscus syriacus]|uniref:Morc S5 domain-containing protein n=1 Tax=Hibiscus syriacus TaxID=106335 RepID=A0A6A2ZRX6_HIBSY|nr:hypothetical protein F3Y22_tig00110782pilonHSYRG00075 [Hibiscus syriacus]
MDPDKMRQCMSLGYSAKSKVANTIGQYGNGFKTSTMSLGADVTVFSRPTQSIGILHIFDKHKKGRHGGTHDYERKQQEWNKIIRSTVGDWYRNLDTIVEWSPFSSEADLFRQDIQLRGVNRDENNIQMATQFPNSRHFLTYKHSLRSYASILYLRLPPNFRIILRFKDVEHHNIVNDMMLTEMLSALVITGFVKDAKHHIDVQGFNIYHKNRLIKPFWRVWNSTGSEGRGAIGVLEANFVEPAHDKQGFERTTVLARLEAQLVQMQKNYWHTNCHRIGYAPRRDKKIINHSLAKEEKCTEFHEIDGGYGNGHVLAQLKQENCELKKGAFQTYLLGFISSAMNRLSTKRSSSCRLEKFRGGHQGGLLNDLPKERSSSKSLEIEVNIDKLNIEHESLISIFSEERDRRDKEQENLRKQLKDASNTIQELLDKVYDDGEDEIS